jgi:nitrite reductase/ring-hydroxylating ferredoxin subunit
MQLASEMIRVSTLDELKSKGCIVARGVDHPIAVFWHEGRVRAVDNRCPHMGFPLSQGSVQDGMLTCHWHHARFDLSSGCTFDLFADDVPVADVELRNGDVWISNRCRVGSAEDHWQRRLQEGMAQDISLVIAKAVIAMQREGRDYRDIVREGARFGSRNRDGWASGMTILTAMANVVPQLDDNEKFLALYHGLSRVADDCFGQPPRRDRHSLEGSDVDPPTLRRWFRHWTHVRHRDAAERTLLTAIERGMSRVDLAEILLAAATDRYYADGGHTLDFLNKSLEMLDLVGWEHAAALLPAVVRPLVGARGGEESGAWRHPVDLISLLEDAFRQMPTWIEEGKGETWNGEAVASEELRSDDPHRVVQALASAMRQGAKPIQLTKALCHAAAMRIARFGTSNEFGDWVTALHTFTYCNALHQSLKRIAASNAPVSLDVLRGVFHGAISIYLDRFLNVPPAALPGERAALDNRPVTAADLQKEYLDVLNTQQRVNAGAAVVARYLALGHPVKPLISTLARSVLREDADFHTFQMLEAAVQQFHEWGDRREGQAILIALARYAAAHAPTQRSQLQTAEIAMRLDRSEILHEEE